MELIYFVDSDLELVSNILGVIRDLLELADILDVLRFRRRNSHLRSLTAFAKFLLVERSRLYQQWLLIVLDLLGKTIIKACYVFQLLNIALEPQICLDC